MLMLIPSYLINSRFKCLAGTFAFVEVLKLAQGRKNLCAVAIVCESVWRAGASVLDNTSGGEGDEAGGEVGWGALTLKSDDVGSKTSDVWAGHGGTGDGAGGSGAADPRGLDVHTWGEDVEDWAEVGEASLDVGRVGGTNGEDGRLRCWGGVAGITTIITGSDNSEDTVGDSAGDGIVGSLREGTAERHGDDRASSAAIAASVVDSPVDTSNDTRVASAAVGTKDLDADDAGALSNTVGGTGDSTSAVSSMSVSISGGLAGDEVGTHGGTSTELGVLGVDTSIDHVDGGAGTSGVIVDVAGSSSGAARDTDEAVLGRALLHESAVVEGDWGRGVDLAVWLNAEDTSEVGNHVDNVVITIESESLEATNIVLVLWLDLSGGSEGTKDIGKNATVLKTSDPAALDGVCVLATIDGGNTNDSWHSQEDVEDGVHLDRCRGY